MPARTGARVVRRLAAIVAASVWLLAAPAPASAHGELVSSDPAANASLSEPPIELALTFTEPVDPANTTIELLDPQQTVVDGVGEVVASDGGNVTTVALPQLEPGVYVVRYQVLSTVDGHVTGGSFAFQIDPSGNAPRPDVAPTSATPSADLLTAVARWVALVGALVLFGAAFFWNVTARPLLGDPSLDLGGLRIWRLFAVAALVTFVGLAIFLTLASRNLPSQPTGLLDAFDFAAPFGWTPFGIAMRVAEVASFAALVVSVVWWFRQAERRHRDRSIGEPRGERFAQLVILVLAVVTLAGFSFAGHVAALGGPGFALVDLAHLLAVGVWLGSLPAYLALWAWYARRLEPEPRRDLLGAAIRRHSRFALLAAPVVALTGIANSPIVLGATRNLVASDYGNLLLGKALLFSTALGIGAANFFLVRRLALRRLLFTIGAELAVAALAIFTAAGLLTVPATASRAPRLVATEIPTAHLYGDVGAMAVHTIVSVPSPGGQTYQVAVSDAESGEPVTDLQRVFIRFEPPGDAGLAEERVQLDPTELPGLYETGGAYTPVVGEWTIEVILREAGEPDASVAFEVPVETPPPPEQLPPADTGIGTPAPLAALWRLIPPEPYEWLPAMTLFGLAGVLWVIGAPQGGPRDGRARAVGVMRSSFVVLGVAAALVTSSQMLVRTASSAVDEGLPTENPVAATAESVEAGEQAYRATCAVCHGADGRGDGPAADGLAVRPADLPVHVPFHSDAELYAFITRGISGTPMPGFATELAPEDRWNLVNYLRSRWPEQ